MRPALAKSSPLRTTGKKPLLPAKSYNPATTGGPHICPFRGNREPTSSFLKSSYVQSKICETVSMHDSRQDGPTTYRSCRPFAFPCHENFPSWLDGAIVDADVVDQAGEEGAPSGIPSGADTHGLRGLRSWAPPTFGHDHIVHMHRTECSRQSHQGWAGQLRYGKFGSF